MHLLRTTTRLIDENEAAVDLGQTPADFVFLSFSDSDLGVMAAALEGETRFCARLAPLFAADTDGVLNGHGVLTTVVEAPEVQVEIVDRDEKLYLSARNIAGVRMVPSQRLTARDVMNTGRVVLTRAAMERLQEVLG